MNEVNGEFWELSSGYDAIVCPTGGHLLEDEILFMKGRFTERFAEKFPKLPAQFGRLVSHYGNSVYALLSYTPIIISFPTRHSGNGRDFDLIKQSALGLKTIADANKFKKVLLPQIENCCMGAKWAEIRPIIASFLDERFDIANRMV